MIGILLIATNKYKQFVPGFVASVEKYFMRNKKINICLFTDEVIPELFHSSERINITQTIIPSYKFPYATLYRYRIFLNHEQVWRHCSYLFYFDVDMKIVAPIGEEMLQKLVAVRHPGFDKVGGGSWERNPDSACYTQLCDNYYAGGVQGGKTGYFRNAMKEMNWYINEDLKNDIIPVWHDESAWNCYLSENYNFKELDSSYCMVEQIDLRHKWHIAHLQPKIIALAKNHELIRM